MKFILGKKIGMAQIFNEKKEAVPITLIEAGPCEVLQIKNNDKDGYEAIQIGFLKIAKDKKIKKPLKNKPFKYIKEFKNDVDSIKNYKVGQNIDVSTFKEGDLVKISGISKGKGFQGGVKRHGFAGRNKTHGAKHEERTIGSVGSSWPQRVIKGKKMPGRMGSERVSIKNLKVIKINKDNNLLAIMGAVPGNKGVMLEISGK